MNDDTFKRSTCVGDTERNDLMLRHHEGRGDKMREQGYRD